MTLDDEDSKLLRALVHDAHLRSDSAEEVEAVHEMLGIAEAVIAGVVTAELQRHRAREVIHPSTAALYLDS